MNNKYIIVLILILISLVSVNAVFASDANSTLTSTEDSNQELSSITENDTLLQQSQSFRDLSGEIRAHQGNEFNLTSDYSYDSLDFAFSDGIPISRNITINGNGHTLDADSGGRIFKITDDSLNVVLKNINFINGKIKENGGAIYGKCTVINCTFKNNVADKGGALYMASAINCTFDKNSAREGGAIYIDVRNVLIENCTFIDNVVTEYGGAVSINEVTGITIANSTFRENKARYGGSLSVRYSQKLSLTNSEFISNQASIEGGAIHYEFALQNTLYNSYFENNIAGQNGGALTWILSNGNIAGNRFKRNTATGNGGAIFADISNTTALMNRQVLTDCNFTANSAKNGGALYCGEFYRITNGTFTFVGNSARENGGAVYCKDSCSFLNSVFLNNTAQDNGGALYCNDYSSIIGSKFINNYAQDNGGGIFANNSGFLFDNQFINNSANIGGGLYSNNGCNVSKADFINNSAEYEGGAIYTYRNSVIYNVKFNNNTALYGGAVYCDRDNEFAYDEFIRNYASKGPAIYTENTHNVISDTVFLQNKQEYTNIGITQNDFMLSVKFLDDKYHFNAIYSWFNIECSNITYWNGTITTTEDMDTYGGAGINFTLEVFDSNNNLVEKRNCTTDNSGRFIYDYFDLDGGRYTIKISHEEDDYYPEFSQNYTVAFGDFAKLQTLLSHAREDGIINLTRNYTFSIGYDTIKYFNVYCENLTINGNGYTIDGLNQGTSFSLNNMKNVNFYNCTFKNGVNFNIRSDNFLISDCDFENITNMRLSRAQSCQIINCNFDNHKNESYYGACDIHDNVEVIIKNCNFTNIIANGANGAAISLNNNNVESIINCNFINNTDSSRGGAIYGRNLKNLYLVNCSFTNNSANAGGALHLGTAINGKIYIDGCQFIGNTANGTGAAMDIIGETQIKNSVFLKNKASSKSIAITADLDKITVKFEGSNNYLNAINSISRLSFDNVTYWDGTVTNTNEKSPIESSPGVNITILAFDKDDNLIFQTIEKTDENGQVIYDMYKLPFETKYVVCYHEDDDYYAKSVNATMNVTRIGDFDRLQRLIDDAGENGVVNLTRNYTYSDGLDTIRIVTINYNNITINGNGHTINGFNKSGMIRSEKDGLTLNNITFIDGGHRTLVYLGANTEINDCNFINNNIGSTYADIWIYAGNLIVKNTNFINTSGRVINLDDGTTASIYGCNFINNTQAISAGGESLSKTIERIIISASNFVNNSDVENAAALLLKAKTVIIENSNFTNNKGTTGGAINFDGKYLNITNSTFTGNIAKVDGGAIYLKADEFTMNDCTFISNTANDSFGGAISAKTYVSNINASEFFNNSASLEGGAIYSDANMYLNVYDSVFRFNSANMGSAIYCANGESILKNTILLDNKAQSKSLLQEGDIESDIIIKFEGNDNYVNAIYSNLIRFHNVTYWNGKVVNSDDVSPVEGICSGQNITIEIYDDENNLVDNTTMVSDGQNKIYYNLVNLGNGNYKFKAYHIADNYYSYMGGCEGTFLVNRSESSVKIDIDSEIELFYPNFKISFNITHKTVSRVVITNANGSQVYFDEIVDDDYVIVDLDPSEEYYNITVYNNPTLSYLGSQDSKLFLVSKIKPSIMINPIQDNNYNNMFNVTFDGENLETVNVTVFDIYDNIVYNEITANKYVTIPVLPVGAYNITITTNDDRYHTKSINSTTFNITPANNNVQVIVENVIYGNITTIMVVADVDGNYTVDVNGTIMNVTVSNNRGNVTVSLGAGKYYANATYDNGNYSSNITNTIFEVYQAVNNIIVSVENVTYGDVSTVVVVADVDGNYTVDVNGTIVNVTVSNNRGNVTLSLGAGKYYANATFYHNNYSSNVTNAVFEVHKAVNTGWIVISGNMVYGNEVNVMVTADVNGVYSMDINGKITNVTVVNNVGFERLRFDVGIYHVNVTFDNENYTTNIPNATFNITKANNKNVEVYAYDVTYGEKTEIVIDHAVDGVYAIDINGTILNVTVKDSHGYLALSLGAGRYYATVTFDNENYITPIVNTLFEVYQAENNVTVSVSNVTYGEDAVIVVSADADGVYSVDVNGTVLNVTVVNGTGNVSMSLGAGKYYANATFNNANYSTNVTNATFEVYQAANNIVVSVGNVTYGEDTVIVVSADADGVYAVDVNGTVLNVTVVNGTGNASMSLGAGKYYANASFDNGNYSAIITNAVFEVYKAKNEVIVSVDDIIYNAPAVIVVSADVDGVYAVDVNGTKVNVNVFGNIGYATLFLDAGNYYANTTFVNGNYSTTITNAVFEVSKAINTVVVSVDNVTYGDVSVIVVSADVDDVYEVDVNGTKVNVTVFGNIGYSTLPLNAGKYYANTTFESDNYISNITNAVFEVHNAVNNIKVVASDVIYGEDSTIIVFADVDGVYQVNVNGTILNINVSEKIGYATLHLSAGKYYANVTFKIDNYDSNITNAVFEVYKAVNNVKVVANSVDYGKDVVLEVTADVDGNYTLDFNGQESLINVVNGSYSTSLRLDAGKYYANVTFENGNYSTIITNTTFEVYKAVNNVVVRVNGVVAGKDIVLEVVADVNGEYTLDFNGNVSKINISGGKYSRILSLAEGKYYANVTFDNDNYATTVSNLEFEVHKDVNNVKVIVNNVVYGKNVTIEVVADVDGVYALNINGTTVNVNVVNHTGNVSMSLGAGKYYANATFVNDNYTHIITNATFEVYKAANNVRIIANSVTYGNVIVLKVIADYDGEYNLDFNGQVSRIKVENGSYSTSLNLGVGKYYANVSFDNGNYSTKVTKAEFEVYKAVNNVIVSVESVTYGNASVIIVYANVNGTYAVNVNGTTVNVQVVNNRGNATLNLGAGKYYANTTFNNGNYTAKITNTIFEVYRAVNNVVVNVDNVIYGRNVTIEVVADVDGVYAVNVNGTTVDIIVSNHEGSTSMSLGAGIYYANAYYYNGNYSTKITNDTFEVIKAMNDIKVSVGNVTYGNKSVIVVTADLDGVYVVDVNGTKLNVIVVNGRGNASLSLGAGKYYANTTFNNENYSAMITNATFEVYRAVNNVVVSVESVTYGNRSVIVVSAGVDGVYEVDVNGTGVDVIVVNGSGNASLSLGAGKYYANATFINENYTTIITNAVFEVYKAVNNVVVCVENVTYGNGSMIVVSADVDGVYKVDVNGTIVDVTVSNHEGTASLSLGAGKYYANTTFINENYSAMITNAAFEVYRAVNNVVVCVESVTYGNRSVIVVSADADGVYLVDVNGTGVDVSVVNGAGTASVSLGAGKYYANATFINENYTTIITNAVFEVYKAVNNVVVCVENVTYGNRSVIVVSAGVDGVYKVDVNGTIVDVTVSNHEGTASLSLGAGKYYANTTFNNENYTAKITNAAFEVYRAVNNVVVSVESVTYGNRSVIVVSAGVDGVYLVDVNGTGVDVIVVDGSGNVSLSLGAGKYYANVTFEIENYVSKITNATFEVYRAINNVVVSVENVAYGNESVIVVSAGVDGVYLVDVNGTTVEVIVSDHKGNASLSLGAGKYYANTTFINENYSAMITNDTFEVYRAVNNVVVSVESVTYGNRSVIVVSAGVDGVYLVDVNGTSVNVSVVNGVGNASLSLGAGKYYANATFEIENYVSKITNATFEVYRAVNNVVVSVDNVTYGNASVIVVSADADGVYLVDVNGTSVNVTVKNKKGQVTLPLSAGKYYANVSFDNGNYSTNVVNAVFEVYRAVNNVVVSVENVTYGENSVIAVSADVDGVYLVDVNGTRVNVTVKNKKGQVTLPLSAGRYYANVTFEIENYVSKITNDTFEVYNAVNNIKVVVSNVIYGEESIIVVFADVDGVYTVDVNGTRVNVNVSANIGYATLHLDAGKYYANVTFEIDNYDSNITNAVFEVYRAVNNVRVVANNVVYGNDVVLKVLADVDGEYTLDLNGQHSKINIVNGSYFASYSLGAGKYYANVTFDNGNYSSIITNDIFEVYKAVNNVVVRVNGIVYGEDIVLEVLADVDGEYTLDFNGNVTKINISGGKYSISLSLGEGKYYANVMYNNENYTTTISNIEFEVKKSVNNVKVIANNVVYGKDVLIEVNADVDGVYVVDVNGTIKNVTVVNHKGNVTLSLGAGKYYANVTFNDTDYTNIITNAMFEVYKAINNVRVVANSVTYGNDVVLKVLADYDGEYTLDLNGKISRINVVNGSYSISLSPGVGKYYANVSFSDDNYLNIITNASFEVYKAVNNVVVSVDSVTYGDDSVIKVYAGVDGVYSVDVNGINVNVTVKNYTGNVTLSLAAGKYYANATYHNGNYSTVITNTVFEVYKAVNNVVVSVDSVTYGEDSVIVVSADVDGVYLVDVNGIKVNVTVVNKIGNVTLSLAAGKYYANASYYNGNYSTKFTNAIFEVYNAVNNIRVVASNVIYGEESGIIVFADVDGVYTVNVNGTRVNVNVSANIGYATLHLDAGKYYANVTFEIDNYVSNITNAVFEVYRAVNNVRVVANNVVYGNDVVLEVIADVDGEYTLDLNGQHRKINVVNGSYSASYRLGAGKYYANVTFDNGNYSSIITNDTFEVYKAVNNVVVRVNGIVYGEDIVLEVLADVDGEYTLDFNGNVTKINISGGKYSISLSLGEGKYYANVMYENENYTTTISNIEFEVKKSVNNVKVIANNVVYGKDVLIEVNADVDGVYVVDVNGTIENVTVVNHKGNVTLSLGAGKYYANVTFNDTDYTNIITNTMFEVYKAINNVRIVANSVTYGNDVVLKVLADYDGEYTLDLNGKISTINVENGNYTTYLTLGVGKYYAKVSSDNGNYSIKSINTTFEVYKAINNVIVSVNSVTYGNMSVVIVYANIAGVYTVDVNGTILNISVADNRGNATLYLGAGKYYANVTFDNGNYSTVINNAVFEVYKAVNNVRVSVENVTYGKDSVIVVTADADGVYSVDVNGTTVNVTVNNHKGAASLPLGVGKYYADASYYNGNYSTKFTNAVFEVYKAVNNVRVSVENVTYGKDSVIVVSADADGVYEVDVNGTIVNVTVNNHKGVASLPLGVGKYYADASYYNVNYSTKFTNAVFEVYKAVNNVKVSVDNVTYGDVSVIVVTADVDGVYLVDVNGTSVNVTVLGNRGYGKLNLGAGRYYANASYYNANYSNVINKAVFEVYKAVNNVKVSVDDVTYGDASVIVVTADADGVYEVDVNGTILNVTVSGNIGYNTLFLGAGKYYANASYYNGNYSNKITNAAFEVHKAQNTVKIIVNSITYGDKSRIIVSADADGVYKVDVNGTIVNVTVAGNRGIATLSLGAGKYYANAYFENGNYSTIITNATFEVYKAVNNVRVIVNNGTYSETFMIFVSADVDGVYAVDVNGTTVNVTVVGNRGIATLSLGVGKYYANASFENGNYTANIINTIFEIYKAENNVVVSVENVTYGNKSVIVVSANADGVYKVDVNGTIVNVTVVNKTGNASVTLSVGKYYANVSYYNGNYSTIITNATFEVYKAQNNVVVSVVNVTYGNESVIVVSADVDGIYEVDVNGTSVNVTVVNGTGNASLSLGAGKYYANVTFEIENYVSNITNATFEVYKAQNNVVVSVVNVTYGNESVIVVSADADGVYVVNVNGTTVNVTVVNGTGNASVSLGAGKYYANVTFENGNYTSNIANATFEVYKAQNNVVVSVGNVIYGNESVIVVSADADGVYVVNVNGTTVNVTVVNKTGKTSVSLSAGKYYANATFDNGNYNSNVVNASFEVYKAINKINVTVSNVTYGNESVIVVTADADGVYKVDVNGTIVNVTVVNGTGSASVSLGAGKYYANVTFENDNYVSDSINASFEVYKTGNNVKVIVHNAIYGENLVIEVVADVDGVYTVDINGENRTINVENGTGSISLILDAGEYNVNVSFIDSNYDVIMSNATFKVLPVTEYDIEVGAGYDNGVHIYAILPHLATGNLTIRVADNKYTKEIDNGIVLFDPLDLNAGDVNVTVHYDGDKNYVSKTFNVTVHVKRIMIDAYDVKYGWANSIIYSVKLIDENENAVAGRQVLISINGQRFKSITDDNGIAAVSLSLNIGTHDIKISHLSETVVKKISVVSRFSGNKNINMYYFDGSKYTFKVYGDDGNVVGANQNVVIKLNKKTYNVKTNNGGVVSFTIPKTLKKLGSYAITATYKGQTIKNTVKVKQILKSKKTVKVKRTAKKLVLKAKLKKKLKGKKIIFKFKGKKYKSKTNKNGVAKIKINKKVIKKLKKGKTYKVIISYYKINIKTKVKVR